MRRRLRHTSPQSQAAHWRYPTIRPAHPLSHLISSSLTSCSQHASASHHPRFPYRTSHPNPHQPRLPPCPQMCGCACPVFFFLFLFSFPISRKSLVLTLTYRFVNPSTLSSEAPTNSVTRSNSPSTGSLTSRSRNSFPPMRNFSCFSVAARLGSRLTGSTTSASPSLVLAARMNLSRASSPSP